ncbi:uncharacterized protein N7482_000225, partial [Penicillium canariense]
MPPQPPILLLKTKSSPHDGYDDFFSATDYTPAFIPVLEHRFHTENLATVRKLFASGAFDTDADTPPRHGPEPNGHDMKYGGMIFTSQRAVEGFAKMIEENGRTYSKQRTDGQIAHLTHHQPSIVPSTPSKPPLLLYTVGPATARSLTTLRDKYLPTATIHGADAGNGENLAHLMLDHYNGIHSGSTNPALLFLVGEQRRDIIPKTLMDPARPAHERIPVNEIVVYETGEMDSFESDFAAAVQKYEGVEALWVVVFSPTGCEAMLRVLGLGPFGTAGAADRGTRRIFVATIGPTTRDFLRKTFAFEADVCAETPSPEGVGRGDSQVYGGSTGG